MGMFVLLIGLFLFSMPSWSSESNGAALLKKCNATVNLLNNDAPAGTESYSDASFCLGMMQGVVNTNQLYQVQLKKKAVFCVPPTGINNGQAARIVTKYLKNNPEKLHENDSLLVVMALREAFPCEARKIEH